MKDTEIKILNRKIDSLKEDFRDKFKFIQKQNNDWKKDGFGRL